MTDRHVLPPYSLRMPADLREKLEVSAKLAKRSLNAEIIARLEGSYSLDDAYAEQAAYAEWAEQNDVQPTEQSIVVGLTHLRILLSQATESLQRVERLYDERTGEHALTVDDDGNLIKTYER